MNLKQIVVLIIIIAVVFRIANKFIEAIAKKEYKYTVEVGMVLMAICFLFIQLHNLQEGLWSLGSITDNQWK